MSTFWLTFLRVCFWFFDNLYSVCVQMEYENFWETRQTFYLYVYKPKQSLISILINRIKNCETENSSKIHTTHNTQFNSIHLQCRIQIFIPFEFLWWSFIEIKVKLTQWFLMLRFPVCFSSVGSLDKGKVNFLLTCIILFPVYFYATTSWHTVTPPMNWMRFML